MRVPRRDAGGGRETTLSFGVALRSSIDPLFPQGSMVLLTIEIFHLHNNHFRSAILLYRFVEFVRTGSTEKVQIESRSVQTLTWRAPDHVS